MNEFFQRAAGLLGLRQRYFQATFGENTPGHDVLVDLAAYSHAFTNDATDMSHDQIMIMHGRRQVFFRIFNHLKLAPFELEAVYKTQLLRAAARIQVNQGVDNE